MKKSDLYREYARLHREYARVIDMCEGAGIDPRLCWKYSGVIQSCSPLLNGTPEEYEFALAIVEGKPVFEGDVLYFDGTCVAADIVVHRATADYIVDQKGGCWSIDKLHWTPPKPKTITVTIPRPDNVTWNDDFIKLFW